MQNYERHAPDGITDDLRETIDGTPRSVAAIALIALVTLAALNRAGFRFSFGVSAGR